MRKQGSPRRAKPKSRPLIPTDTPGVYRRGSRYVAIYRDPSGKQRKKSARTYAEARSIKAAATTDVERGDWREQSNARFIDYAPEWATTYQGRTTRGVRDNTRGEYLRDLGFDRDAKPVDRAATFFGRMRLREIEPQDVRRYYAELADAGLSASTIRKLRAPLSAMLATAVEDHVIRFNPCVGVRIPSPKRAPTKPARKHRDIGQEQVARLLELIEPYWRLLIEFLIYTGLRFSEVKALNWSHVVWTQRDRHKPLTWANVDWDRCYVSVEVRDYKGVDAPKSEYGIRAIPLTSAMAQRLWKLRAQREHVSADDPVFTTPTGTRIEYSNVYHRVLTPAMRVAGIDWGAFHRFRHTCGTVMKRKGASDSQIQLWLGHHDPGFTARTYIHLDSRDLPDPTLFDSFLAPEGGNKGATGPTETDQDQNAEEAAR